MSEKTVIIDPFLHKRAGISRDEFLDRLEYVKAIRTRKNQLSFYFDSPNKWENIEHFHYIIKTGDFSKQKLSRQIPFALEIPISLFRWMKETPVQIIQKQILFWLSGYYVFNTFKEYVSKELKEPIWREVKEIVNKYYPQDYQRKFIIDDNIDDPDIYKKIHEENIKYYWNSGKAFIGKDLPEIFVDPSRNPVIQDIDNKWGLTNELQFEYSISYFTQIDWTTIVARNPKELGKRDSKEIKKIMEFGEKDNLLRIESNQEMFEKWKYTYKMYDIRKSNIYSIYSDAEKKNTRENIPQHTKDKVWKRDEGKCVKCGSEIKLEFDHKIPVSKGGKSTYRNLQLLCENCNRKKYNKID